MTKKDTRDVLVRQALEEIAFARRYKRGKITNWQKNEDLYYGKKHTAESSRANVDLGRMQEFVHTVLSKIDNPLVFKFTKRKDAQLKRVARLNALRQFDAQRDNWDIKDIAGKKQALLYGRAIYSYSADSYNGYCPHLENVDVYDFLIDPSAGGIDLERASYLGRYGVVKTKSELKKGVSDRLYIRNEVSELIDSGGNATETTEETRDQRNRTYGQNHFDATKEMSNKDRFVFWEWYTTLEGERYYLLLSESGRAIRVEKLTELFASNLWPFWSWACSVDLTEFWTPSYADYVREIFMAQSVSINQMLDNAEQINKPQKIVDVGAIENLAELKYRKDGYIKTRSGTDANKAVRIVETPSIKTPLDVYEILEGIQEKASGVTGAAKGIAEEDKVGIYEGNAANTADRFGLLNKSYSFGYTRFANLYEHGVREHLTKKIAVDILGPDGVEVEEVSKRDIFRKNETFGLLVESSAAETSLSELDKRNKLQFLIANTPTGLINPQKAIEMQAGIAGLSEEEIRGLLDVSEFGDAEMMSEAERDIEAILDGKELEPNRIATAPYKQRFVDFMSDNEEDIDDEQARRLFAYIDSLEEVILLNTMRKAKEVGADPNAAGPMTGRPQSVNEKALPPLENNVPHAPHI